MTIKIAISLPDEQVESARRAVAEKRSASVSAYISEAIAERERSRTLAELLTDWETEEGPVSQEALDWADQQLGSR